MICMVLSKQTGENMSDTAQAPFILENPRDLEIKYRLQEVVQWALIIETPEDLRALNLWFDALVGLFRYGGHVCAMAFEEILNAPQGFSFTTLKNFTKENLAKGSHDHNRACEALWRIADTRDDLIALHGIADMHLPWTQDLVREIAQKSLGNIKDVVEAAKLQNSQADRDALFFRFLQQLDPNKRPDHWLIALSYLDNQSPVFEKRDIASEVSEIDIDPWDSVKCLEAISIDNWVGEILFNRLSAHEGRSEDDLKLWIHVINLIERLHETPPKETDYDGRERAPRIIHHRRHGKLWKLARERIREFLSPRP